MRVKFTKRSAKDGDLVTVTLHQFDNTELDFCSYACDIGDEVTFVVEGIPTVFTLARPNKHGYPTVAVSRGLPRSIRLPRVGRPIYAEVSEVR